MKVSVMVLTYGHEKYIAQCLDSILMQKTQFDFEVIVGEDASPDNTRKILMEYERKYPNRFQMLYHKTNVGAKINMQDCFTLCHGKYIAFCEGDDFWLDENKLQIQIDFLEAHPEASAVYHEVVIVDKNGKKNESLRFPSSPSRKYSLFRYDMGFLPGQLASLVMINIFKTPFDFSFLARKEMTPGDRVLPLILMFLGSVYCLPHPMSAYRLVSDEGLSYTARKPFLTKEWQYMSLDKWPFLFAFFKQNHAFSLYRFCYYQNIKENYRIGHRSVLLHIDKALLPYCLFWGIRRTLLVRLEAFFVRLFHIRPWRYIGRRC